MDTAIAAASLIFGKVLENYPPLNILLVHGGGAFPFIIGRISQGYSAIEICRTIPRSPREYYDNTGEKDPIRALGQVGLENCEEILGKTAAGLLGIGYK
jgi:hypothetical protein